MKNIAFIIAFLFVAGQLEAQEFCGHIKYRYIYKKTKTGQDVTSKTNDVKTEDFYICGNKFKTYFDGDLENIYIGDSATYFQAASPKTLGYIRADSAYGQEPPEYLKRNGAIYNGKSYHTVETGPEGDRITYYYNDVIRINPKSFGNFYLYHWNTFFNSTNGGIRLVSIYVDPEDTVISEAILIESKVLTDEDFVVPEGYSYQPYQSMSVE